METALAVFYWLLRIGAALADYFKRPPTPPPPTTPEVRKPIKRRRKAKRRPRRTPHRVNVTVKIETEEPARRRQD